MLTPDLFTEGGYAFSRNKVKIDWLLSMKADVNKAPFGQAGREYGTVWTVLASAGPQTHYREGASYLILKGGVDVNMKKASGAHESLFCAFLRNTGRHFDNEEALKLAQLFIKCGADVEQADDEKKDALWICTDLIENHPYPNQGVIWSRATPAQRQECIRQHALRAARYTNNLRELLQAMKRTLYASVPKHKINK